MRTLTLIALTVLSALPAPALQSVACHRRGAFTGGYPASFTATDWTTCQGWYRADTIVGLNDGDTISSWSDESGNARDFNHAGGYKWPKYETNEINGLPMVHVYAANGKNMTTLTGSGIGGDNTYVVVYVCRFDSDPGVGAVGFCEGDQFGSVEKQYSGDYFGATSTNNFGENCTTHPAAAYDEDQGSWHVWYGERNGSAIALYCDGVLVDTGTNSECNDSGGAVMIGDYMAESASVVCGYAELVIYSDVQLPAARAEIIGRLKAKYGITP